MSQSDAVKELEASGHKVLTKNERWINYKFNLNKNIYQCQFHFTPKDELRNITIYPVKPYRLSRETCNALMQGIKQYIEKDFGAPVVEYDIAQELEKSIKPRSKCYVYRKGKTTARLAYLDYGGRYLFDVLIGPDTYVEIEMEKTLGKNFKTRQN